MMGKISLVVLLIAVLVIGVCCDEFNPETTTSTDRPQLAEPSTPSLSTHGMASIEPCEENQGCDPECRSLHIISYDFHQLIKTPEFDTLVSNTQKDDGIVEGAEILDFGNSIENITKSLRSKIPQDQPYSVELGYNGVDTVAHTTRFSGKTPGQAFCKSGRCVWTKIRNVHTGESAGNSTNKDTPVFWKTLGGICKSVDFRAPKKQPDMVVQLGSDASQIKNTWTIGLFCIITLMTMQFA